MGIRAMIVSRWRRRRARPLRRQLADGLMLVASLPLVVMSLYYCRLLMVDHRRESGARLVDAARAGSRAVDEYLLKHLEAISSLADSLNRLGLRDQSGVSPWLADCQRQYPGFLTLLAADEQGLMFAAQPARTPSGDSVLAMNPSVLDREYFKVPMATGESFVSGAFQGRGFGADPIVAISAPLRNREGRVVGIIEGSLDLSRLRLFGSEYATMAGSEWVLLDSANRVVNATAAGLYPALSTVEGDAMFRRIEAGGKERNFEYSRTRPGRQAGGEAMLAGWWSESRGGRLRGWTTIVQQPMSVVYGQVYTYIALAAWSVVGALVLSMWLSRYLAGRITRPLEELVQRLEQSVTDEVPRFEPAKEGRGVAEIDMLIRCFGEMSARLTVAFDGARRELQARELLNRDLVESQAALRAAHAELEGRVAQRTRELSSLNATLRTLVDHQRAGIVFENPDRQVVFMNPSSRRLLAASGEGSAVRFADAVRGAFLEPGRAVGFVEEAVQCGGPAGDVAFQLSHGGHVEVDYTPVRADGALLGHLWQIRDMTERVRAESALRRLSIAVEQSPVVVFITDRAGVIEYVNPRFVEQTGFSSAEAIGRTPRILKSGGHSPAFYHQLWERIRAGKAFYGELCNRRKGGETYWVFAAIAPIRDATQEVTGFVAVEEDITAQKAAEEQARLALQREREASDMKTRFITTISHEFRTPLAAIQLSTELLDDLLGESEGADRVRPHLRRVSSAIQRLKRMLDEVITVNRAERGKLVYQLVPVGLEGLIREVADDSGAAHGAAGRIRLAFLGSGDRTPVLTDPEWLRTIVTNLLGNAQKFSRPEQEIRLEVRQDDTEYEIAVIDRGIGIPEHDYDRIYTPFERGRNVGNIQGTGLGLSITKKLVETLGGRIAFDSRPGEGTRFRVRLPRNLAPPGAEGGIP